MDRKELKGLHYEYLQDSHFDHLAFAKLDFKNSKTISWCLNKSGDVNHKVFFDLASLTKPLVLGLYFLKNQNFFESTDYRLLLEHRAGLPSYGALSKNSWKEQILSYQIKESPTLYSDYSSLRLMLEIGPEKLFKNVELEFNEIKFWKKLTTLEKASAPETGYRLGRIIKGEVHDPNAYLINDYCSHSGLFGTIVGVANTLLEMNNNYELLKRHINRSEHLFFEGWEGVSHPGTTLAGRGCSDNTFGFLGFTGTSIWIDPDRQIGWVLLTNVTKKYWFERKRLNQLRRNTGELVWRNS